MTLLSAPPGRPRAPEVPRIDGYDKVTGRAHYAYERQHDDMAYAHIVQSTIAKGRISSISTDAALALPGVLAVLTPDNAPRLVHVSDGELAVFQSHEIAYFGQAIAAVVASTLEVAQEASGLLDVDYDQAEQDVVLTADHPGMYKPEKVNPNYETDSEIGDFATAFAAAPIRLDATYETPTEHNNPMEPHATVATWDGDALTVIDSNQGPFRVVPALADAFGLEQGQVRVIVEHVGGGFGSKGLPRPNIIVAAMAARVVGRPVKCALTRQQMFSITGYRTPSIQRVRLGADQEGVLRAIGHDVFEQSSTVKEFAEQTAVVTRHMYAAANRRTTHRLVRLDVPTPAWMRAPGECPGMYALESAMDELATACGLDPIELRVRNEPDTHPETGRPFSSRNLVACLREGAARFGWDGRDPTPGVRRDGRWLIGTGVAASTYPARATAATATVSVDATGRFDVAIAAADIGTGARTAIRLMAADALEADPSEITVRIGDSAMGEAAIAGGSMGTASWGWAVDKACRLLRSRIEELPGAIPVEGLSVQAGTKEDVGALDDFARYAFGAQFAEVRVDVDTGEVRVPRMVGVFAAGRIVSATTARSQLIGGMVMGVSMAVHEEGPIDAQFGHYPHHDLAGYHVATNADVIDIDATWIDEDERHLGPLGIKGIGEIGIVGTAAAVANAVHHATGVRVRDLPIRLDKLLGRLDVPALQPSDQGA